MAFRLLQPHGLSRQCLRRTLDVAIRSGSRRPATYRSLNVASAQIPESRSAEQLSTLPRKRSRVSKTREGCVPPNDTPSDLPANSLLARTMKQRMQYSILANNFNALDLGSGSSLRATRKGSCWWIVPSKASRKQAHMPSLEMARSQLINSSNMRQTPGKRNTRVSMRGYML